MPRFYTLLLVLLATLSLTQLAHSQRAPVPVLAVPVESKPLSDEIEALGTLQANENVDLTSSVTERVTRINFEDGQRVKQGDVLLEMDAAEELARQAEELSRLHEAQRQVKRLERLISAMRSRNRHWTSNDWQWRPLKPVLTPSNRKSTNATLRRRSMAF